jgi:hypothetical protein
MHHAFLAHTVVVTVREETSTSLSIANMRELSPTNPPSIITGDRLPPPPPPPPPRHPPHPQHPPEVLVTPLLPEDFSPRGDTAMLSSSPSSSPTSPLIDDNTGGSGTASDSPTPADTMEDKDQDKDYNSCTCVSVWEVDACLKFAEGVLRLTEQGFLCATKCCGQFQVQATASTSEVVEELRSEKKEREASIQDGSRVSSFDGSVANFKWLIFASVAVALGALIVNAFSRRKVKFVNCTPVLGSFFKPLLQTMINSAPPRPHRRKRPQYKMRRSIRCMEWSENDITCFLALLEVEESKSKLHLPTLLFEVEQKNRRLMTLWWFCQVSIFIARFQLNRSYPVMLTWGQFFYVTSVYDHCISYSLEIILCKTVA